MSEVFKIVITGGPCSGKTTIINNLERIYSDRGYNVIVVPESARILLERGASRNDMLIFETKVAELQIKNEQSIDDFPDNMDTIVFYDRGLTDTFSYLQYDEKSLLSSAIGISSIESWSRYDAVLFLETTALSDCYISDNERCESADEAVQCHNSLLKEWVGHSHFRYIKSAEKLSDKLSRAIQEIDVIVNNIEFEKKFLIEYPCTNLFENHTNFKVDIEQIYLLCKKGSHRIRKREANGIVQYFETIKTRISDDRCIENERIIDLQTYEQLKTLADPRKKPIVKQRYCLLYESQYFEIDIFPFWTDRAIVEIELSGNNDKIIFPPEIKVIKDVSKDRKYKNNYLAGNI